MVSCAKVAVAVMEHQVEHVRHGYTQGSGRWGDGTTETLEMYNLVYTFPGGDRDCASAIITAWRTALQHTDYANALDAATFTGDMRQAFLASGLFEVYPIDEFVAQPGDVYLRRTATSGHTAMCISTVPDMLAEFMKNEHGTNLGGQVGDQTGWESYKRGYYDFPWDVILHYNGKADFEEDDMFTDEDREMLRAVYFELTDTSDPTGRGKTGTMGFKLKHMAGKQEQEMADISEIKEDVAEIKAAIVDDGEVGGTD